MPAKIKTNAVRHRASQSFREEQGSTGICGPVPVAECISAHAGGEAAWAGGRPMLLLLPEAAKLCALDLSSAVGGPQADPVETRTNAQVPIQIETSASTSACPLSHHWRAAQRLWLTAVVLTLERAAELAFN